MSVVIISLVPRPSRLHAIILRAIIWVAFEKSGRFGDVMLMSGGRGLA